MSDIPGLYKEVSKILKPLAQTKKEINVSQFSNAEKINLKKVAVFKRLF